jgi:hypothetical protein
MARQHERAVIRYDYIMYVKFITPHLAATTAGWKAAVHHEPFEKVVGARCEREYNALYVQP